MPEFRELAEHYFCFGGRLAPLVLAHVALNNMCTPSAFFFAGNAVVLLFF